MSKKEAYLITSWSVIINLILLMKWTFTIPHTLIYGSIATLALILFFIISRRKLVYIKDYKEFFYLVKVEMTVGSWIVFFIGITVLIAGFIHHELSNMALGVLIGIIFPLLNIIVRGNATNRFMKSICFGTTIVFVLFILISIIFVPLSYTQYASIIGNPNEMGQYLVFVIPCLLFLYDNYHKFRYIVLIDIAINFIIFSISRTSYVCILAIIIISMMYYLITSGVKSLLLGLVKNIFVFAIIFLLTFGLMTTGNKVLRDIEKNIFGQEYIFYSKLYQYDGTEISLKDLENYISLRVGKGVVENEIVQSEVGNEMSNSTQHKQNVDIEKMSSGRTDIWKAFLSEINIKGHSSDVGVHVKELDYVEDDAHNTYIDNAYYFGIISGFGMVGYIGYFSIYMIKMLYRMIKDRKKRPTFYLQAEMFIAFFITSMLASVFSPFHSSIAFGFWAICMNKKDKVIEKDIEMIEV